MSGVTGQRVYVVVLALLAAASALLSSRHGPGVSPDSVSYLAAAGNLIHGRGLRDLDGGWLTLWPPAYPSLLAAIGATGVSLETAARVVDALCAAATVVLAYVLVRRHVRSAAVVVVAVTLVAVAPALVRSWGMVWTEPLFTLLTLAFVVVLERACRSGRWVDLAIAGLVASAASMTKYFGPAFVLAGVGALVIVLALPWRARLGRAAWFAGWALVASVLWAGRNLARGEQPFGDRAEGTATLMDALRDLVRGLGRIVVPLGTPGPVTTAVAFAVLAGIATATVLAWTDPARPTLIPLVSVIDVSIVFVVAARVGSGSDINARILAPLVAPTIVLFAWALESLHGRLGARTGRLAAGVATVLVLGLFVGWVAWSAGMTVRHGREASGYATEAWATSPLIRATAALPERTAVFTDEPFAVAYAADRRDVSRVLRGDAHRGHGDRTPAELRRLACDRDVVVAWFGDPDRAPAGAARRVDDGVLVRMECAGD